MIAENDEYMAEAANTLLRLSGDYMTRKIAQEREDYYREQRTWKYRLAQQQTVITQQQSALQEKDAALAEKDNALAQEKAITAEKDALIAELRAQLAAAQSDK